MPGTNHNNPPYNGQPAGASSVCAAWQHLLLVNIKNIHMYIAVRLNIEAGNPPRAEGCPLFNLLNYTVLPDKWSGTGASWED